MLVIEDTDLEGATKNLRSAGFQDSTWPYGTLHLSLYTGKLKEDIYRDLVKGYSNLDQNLIRFLFPPEQQIPSEFQRTTKIVLLPSSYAQIRIKSLPSTLTWDKSIIYPDGAVLLLSFIQTLLQEQATGIE